MTAKLLEMLIRDEGVRLKPYRDTVGKLTIGVGRNLDDVGISKEEAYILLKNDLNKAATALFTAFPWVKVLSEARIAALINMAFNLGIGGLAGFKNFLKALKEENFSLAAKEMLDSKWAEQVGSRAYRLSVMIEKGAWPEESVQ
jgi:lysozyme